MVAELVVGWYHIMGCSIRVSPLDYKLFAYPGPKILAGTSVHFF